MLNLFDGMHRGMKMTSCGFTAVVIGTKCRPRSSHTGAAGHSNCYWSWACTQTWVYYAVIYCTCFHTQHVMIFIHKYNPTSNLSLPCSVLSPSAVIVFLDVYWVEPLSPIRAVQYPRVPPPLHPSRVALITNRIGLFAMCVCVCLC